MDYMDETITIKKPVPPTPDPRIRQWVLTVIVALAAGVGVKEALGSTMAAFAGGIAGALASFLIDWIRVLWYERVNTLAKQNGTMGAIGRTLSYVLYNPKGVRLATVGFTLLLGAVAAGILDWTTGQPVSMAIASAWAFLGSQVAHMRSLPSQPTTLTAKRDTMEEKIDVVESPITQATTVSVTDVRMTQEDLKAYLLNEGSGSVSYYKTLNTLKEALKERLKTVEEGGSQYHALLAELLRVETASISPENT